MPKSASKDDWIAHGYSRVRRSRMFVIGDALIKANGEYRAVYLARKEYERQRAEAAGLTVAPALKIPKARANEFISDGIIHRRAQRYMEKRLLRDLWQAWNRGKATPLLSHDETEQRVQPASLLPPSAARGPLALCRKADETMPAHTLGLVTPDESPCDRCPISGPSYGAALLTSGACQ